MTRPSDSGTYLSLPKVLKRRYPFRVSSPSFIYPDTWSVNARMLARHVDEVELLFFESRTEGCLPSREEIEALSQISNDFSIGYNIHLPTDLSLASAGRMEQKKSLDTYRRVMDLTSRLDPTSWTLHIPCDQPIASGTDVVARWQDRAREGLEKLLADGIPPRRLAIENLDYPFVWVQDIVKAYDLSVCMDVGHLLLRGEDIADFHRESADRIAVIHLHGVVNGKDHQPPAVISKHDTTAVVMILGGYTGTLSLEVFSYDYLAESMAWLDVEAR